MPKNDMLHAEGCKARYCRVAHYKEDYCREHYAQWVAAGRPVNWQPAPKITEQDLAMRARNEEYAAKQVRDAEERVAALARRVEEDRVREALRAQRRQAHVEAIRAQNLVRAGELRSLLENTKARRSEVLVSIIAELRSFVKDVRLRASIVLPALALAKKEYQRARARARYAKRKVEARMSPEIQCAIERCINPHSSKGLCVTHYGQWVCDKRPDLATWRPRGRRQKLCLVIGCDRIAPVHAYCSKHRQKWKALRCPEGWRGEGYKIREFCQVPGCGREHKSLGYCEPHYKAWNQDKRPTPWTPRLPPARKVGVETCRVSGCDYNAAADQFCKAHWARWVRANKPNPDTWNPPPIQRRSPRRLCKVPECGRDLHVHGYCHGHGLRWKRLGRPEGWDPPPGPPTRE